MKERVEWLDICKLIGIWLVILGHLNISKNIQIYIYSFHMPFFFLISGYLHKTPSNQFLQVKKHATSLLWPYLTFYIINWLIVFITFFVAYTVITGQSNMTLENCFIKPFLGLIYGNGYDTETSRMLSRPLWFLLALFFVRVIFDFISYFTKNAVAIIIATILLMLVSISLFKNNIDIYFSIDSAFIAIPFFAVGYILNQKKALVNYLKKSNWNILWGIALLTILYFTSNMNETIDINKGMTGRSIFIFTFNALLGSAALILISYSSIKLNNLLRELSQNTLIILSLHTTFILIIFQFIPNDNTSDFLYLILSVLILFFMKIPISIINRHLTFISTPVFRRNSK